MYTTHYYRGQTIVTVTKNDYCVFDVDSHEIVIHERTLKDAKAAVDANQLALEVRTVILIAKGKVTGVPTDSALSMLFDLFERYDKNTVKQEYFKQRENF